MPASSILTELKGIPYFLQANSNLFKIGCSVTERTEVLQISEVFRGKTVDISTETITLEATGTTEKMDALRELLSKFEIKEMVRTGKVVMARGNQAT